MSVHLDPDKEIHFHGPFTLLVKRTITISNDKDNTMPFAYKVTTTAPKSFNIHPDRGIIGPGDSRVVAITFHFATLNFDTLDSLYNRRSDKFQVQSTLFNGNADDPQIISNLFRATGDEREIHSQKLRVRYLPPLKEGESTGPGTDHSTPVPPPSPPPDSQDCDESRSQPSLSIVHALPSTPGPMELSKLDLEQQLRDAQEENRQLRALLARLDDGGSSATDADVRTRLSPPKSLASGVESMVAALRNLVHPLASPCLPDDGDS